MNDFNMVSMFLFSALEGQVAKHEAWPGEGNYPMPSAPPVSVYEKCGMGAYEVAHNLSSIAQEMLDKFNPERPFTDLLYTACDTVAELLYTFMSEHSFMPTSLYSLELSKCQTLK